MALSSDRAPGGALLPPPVSSSSYPLVVWCGEAELDLVELCEQADCLSEQDVRSRTARAAGANAAISRAVQAAGAVENQASEAAAEASLLLSFRSPKKFLTWWASAPTTQLEARDGEDPNARLHELAAGTPDSMCLATILKRYPRPSQHHSIDGAQDGGASGDSLPRLILLAGLRESYPLARAVGAAGTHEVNDLRIEKALRSRLEAFSGPNVDVMIVLVQNKKKLASFRTWAADEGERMAGIPIWVAQSERELAFLLRRAFHFISSRMSRRSSVSSV
eukprot:TRINITY_DN54123_c0_g1_i1.p1 TRINITY_DN54123_c0_g1~~TRINITY_DN54123_c0_g1_i1.p1  ORF type:complete len:278 (-),score=33.97 TRINITY_DN54123_c0_g1_i1:204-1037(-)